MRRGDGRVAHIPADLLEKGVAQVPSRSLEPRAVAARALRHIRPTGPEFHLGASRPFRHEVGLLPGVGAQPVIEVRDDETFRWNAGAEAEVQQDRGVGPTGEGEDRTPGQSGPEAMGPEAIGEIH